MNEVVSTVLSELSAEGICLAIFKVTGTRPSIRVDENGKTIIFWQGEELEKAQAWMQQQTQNQSSPGSVNIGFDFLPVVAPLLYMPAAGLVAGGVACFLLGRVTK